MHCELKLVWFLREGDRYRDNDEEKKIGAAPRSAVLSQSMNRARCDGELTITFQLRFQRRQPERGRVADSPLSFVALLSLAI